MLEERLRLVASMPEKVAKVMKDLRMTVCMAVLPNITLKHWVEKMAPKRGDIVIISYSDKDVSLTCQGHSFQIFKSYTQLAGEQWDVRVYTYNNEPLNADCNCLACATNGDFAIPISQYRFD